MPVMRRRPLVVGEDPLLHVERHRFASHIRMSHTSRHLHHDAVEHDLVPLRSAAARRRTPGTAGQRPRHASARNSGTPSALRRSRRPSAPCRRSCARGTCATQCPAARRRRPTARRCATCTPWTLRALRAPPPARRRCRKAPGRWSTHAWGTGRGPGVVTADCGTGTGKTAVRFSKNARSPSRNSSLFGAADQVLQLLIEVIVEPIDARGLVDQRLGDGECAGRPGGELAGERDHLACRSRPVRDTRVDQAQIDAPRRGRAAGLSSISSIARRRPISRGSRNVELSAPVSPVLPYAHSKVARGDANTRSQDIASPKPPAAAMPSTAAMNGLGARRISEIVLCRYSRICLKRSP